MSGGQTQLGILGVAEATAKDQQASVLPRVEWVWNAGPWPTSESVWLVVVTRACSVE
jgi:hypothetical protein